MWYRVIGFYGRMRYMRVLSEEFSMSNKPLEERCHAILRGNQITSKGYRYTRPAPHVYEQQWLWDSCFHAITYRWLDPAMAWDELYSLIAGQVKDGADAGMIPHMVYWTGGGEALWGHDTRSIITQPPLIAIAALAIYETTGDIAPLQKLYQPLCDYHAWFIRRRDPDNDHLACLIHPWESGWDASPRWDAPLGLSAPTDEQSKSTRHALVKTLRDADCDPRRLMEQGSFCVETADFNAIRSADCDALAKIATILGADGSRWHDEAQAIAKSVREKLIRQSATGELIVCDLSGTDETPILSESANQFVILLGGCPSNEQADMLVNRLKSPAFWTHYPIPTTPSDHPQFDPAHYWRGNVWMSVNWLIWRGLRRYGYTNLARKLAKQSVALVDGHGFHEYFNPLTGEGYGPSQQSWTTLVLDMAYTEK
jgi:glycogen debranching enzyme